MPALRMRQLGAPQDSLRSLPHSRGMGKPVDLATTRWAPARSVGAASDRLAPQ